MVMKAPASRSNLAAIGAVSGLLALLSLPPLPHASAGPVQPGARPEQVLEFGLCRSNVAAVAFVASAAQARVQVQLTPSGTEALRQATAGSTGHHLLVRAGIQVFSRAVIHAEIGSGSLVSDLRSTAEAQTLAAAIEQSRPPQECGRIDRR